MLLAVAWRDHSHRIATATLMISAPGQRLSSSYCLLKGPYFFPMLYFRLPESKQLIMRSYWEKSTSRIFSQGVQIPQNSMHILHLFSITEVCSHNAKERYYFHESFAHRCQSRFIRPKKQPQSTRAGSHQANTGDSWKDDYVTNVKVITNKHVPLAESVLALLQYLSGLLQRMKHSTSSH